jgi:hypothetical protein
MQLSWRELRACIARQLSDDCPKEHSVRGSLYLVFTGTTLGDEVIFFESGSTANATY